MIRKKSAPVVDLWIEMSKAKMCSDCFALKSAKDRNEKGVEKRKKRSFPNVDFFVDLKKWPDRENPCLIGTENDCCGLTRNRETPSCTIGLESAERFFCFWPFVPTGCTESPSTCARVSNPAVVWLHTPDFVQANWFGISGAATILVNLM